VIYVLVPVRDEAATVGLLLWKVRQVFTAFEREYQLLVVDDASTDGTDAVLGPYARALPLTLVTHRERRGYARSVEELLRLAVSRSDRPRRDVAVTIQADFSESPDDLPDLIRRIESGADLVLCETHRRPGVPLGERAARALARTGARALARVEGASAGVGTLRAYRVATLARMLRERGPLLRTDGWAADLELLARAAAVSRRTEIVALASPVPPRQRSSRATPFRSAWDVLRSARRLPRGTGASAPNDGDEEPAPPPQQPQRRGRGRRGGRGRGRGGAPRAAAPPASPGPP
jgi:glycosyltransferase involved in cell wall biosynthesis